MSISTTRPNSPPQGDGTAAPSGPPRVPHGPGAPRIPLWAAALFVAALLCAGLLLERSSFVRQYRAVSLHIATGKDSLGSPRKRQLLAELGLPDVHTVAPEHRDHVERLLGEARADISPALIASGWPVVAIRTDEENLSDPEIGIVANPEERGIAWEHLSSMVYYRDGEERLATGAGLRIHGGGSRKDGISFRLYFRNSYGQSPIPADMFFPGAEGSLKRIVLRKEKTPRPGFVCMLGFDVMARLGAQVPHFVPAIYLVNGKEMGISLLCEHISVKGWHRKLGHGNFLLYNIRKSNERKEFAALRELYLWARLMPAPLTMRQVERRMDLRSMCAIIFGSVYLGANDWDQGAFLLDKTQPDPRWTNIAWDLDQAFQHLSPTAPLERRPGWKFAMDEAKAVRMRLFLRLWKEAPEFRTWFLRYVVDALNHTLRPSELKRMIAPYVAMERQLGREMFDQDTAAAMLAARPVQVMEETVRDLGAPAWSAVHVSSSCPIRIDDMADYTEYTGRYFMGQTVRLHATSQDGKPFSHWEVNGVRHGGPDMELTVEGATTIRAVFSDI
uniref:Uncharacterized protein n=1 Tax=Nitratidesulfovibrio vulgaris (strain DSM 19637 / Miyazaki F) TaxID=883 RepID=B8DJ72_NITV9